jgi:aspartate/methionine/tyrosine aminotransferase
LRPSGIGRISALGNGRAGLIALWYGESDLVTPDFVRDAAKQALDDGHTFYSSSRGLPRLREGIAHWMQRFVDVQVDVERITVPGSAMLSVVLALQCLVREGDEVIVISPMWPNIFQAVQVVGGVPRFVRLRRDAGGPWRLDMDELAAAITPRTKAVFLASPSNPTGWIMPAEQQAALLALCRARGIGIVADEVYGPIVFDGRHAPSFASIARDDDALFIVNSFSKAWAMTGWRIGWLIHPPRLAEAIGTMAVAANTGASSFVQVAAIAAIEQGDEFLATMRARVRRNRDQLGAFIAAQARLDWAEPPGGFYGYVAIDGVQDSMAFATALLEQAGVGVAPGMAFGPEDDRDNDRHVRICLAIDPQRFATALERMGRVIGQL